MAEYVRNLVTTVELKKLNLQNIQLAVRNRELEKENKALKDKLAQLLLKKDTKDAHNKRPSITDICHYSGSYRAD